VLKIRFEDLYAHLDSGDDFIVELGEQQGIGSSSLFIHKHGRNILVDRGLAFEGSGADKRTNFPVGKNLEDIHLDVIILTHVHADHAGLIVPIVLAHPEAHVVFSAKTLEELKIVLADSLSIQKKEARKASILGLPTPKAMFSQEDVQLFLLRAESDFYEIVDTDNEDVCVSWEDLPGWDFGFTFSGHTHGAFISFIKSPDNVGFVVTGDICAHDQETTRGVLKVKESFLKMMNFRECKKIILITEATNGNRDRKETQDEMDNRLKAVLDETLLLGGNALFPVFMINRGPNMVIKLVRLGYKVFVAGGVRKTLKAEIGSKLFDKWTADKTVMLIQDGVNYEHQVKSASHGEYGFRPIVTSSATLDQGAGIDFAIEMLPNPKNVLISTGHRFDGSKMQEFFAVKDNPVELGRTIVLNKTDNRFREIKKPVHIRCDGHHFDYSAHSYRKDLVAFVASLNPEIVFVKHCTNEGFHGLETALRDSFGDKCPSINRASHLCLFKL